jgi:hypothetical protein
MPATVAPSAETTRAPTRSSRMRRSASPTAASGATVRTSLPLAARIASTFIGHPLIGGGRARPLGRDEDEGTRGEGNRGRGEAARREVERGGSRARVELARTPK